MKNIFIAVFLTFYLISGAQTGINSQRTWKKGDNSSDLNALGRITALSSDASLSNLVLSQGTLSPVFATNTTSYNASVANSVTSITVTPTAADAGATIVSPGNLLNINGTLFFSATDANGTELWKSDGTLAGTVMVKDIFPGPNSSSPADFVNLNGVLFFSADDGVFGKELWKSDGTANGTVMVKDGVTGSSAWGQFPGKPDTVTPNSNHLRLLTVAGSTVFFLAVDHTNGTELWVSTGTTASTHAIDIYPGLTNNSNPANLTNVNGILYFSGQNANGVELWKSDGSDAGTVLVKDINPTGSSSPSNFVNVNGTLYFTADDGTNGRELWKSDGTAAGTVLVANISSGAGNSSPDFLTNVNGILFFAANAGVDDAELWKSDGTPAGTVRVKDVFPGVGGSHPRNFINLNGTLLFVPYSGPDGFELWKSDGTDAGTVLVKNINPGGFDSNPENLTVVGSMVLFSADDGTHGRELWQTNGTANGTTLFQDFETGNGSSNPQNITALSSNVALSATTTANGNKLWIYNSSTLQWQIIGNSSGAGATITVNGTPVTSGSASTPIPLSVGINIITTIVTAQDGTTTKTYSTSVTRAVAPSNNANLSNLVLSQGTLTPVFAAATISYTASVANSVTSITVTPTKADAGASITVNGTPVTSGTPTGSITLAVGSNSITTIVTAQDGTATKTYTVNITRAAAPSNNANLSNLALSQGTLAPSFAAATISYTASVANNVTSITVTPTKADAGASITVNGTSVTSGTPSGSIALAVGSNTITTIVTAQDGTTTKTYTVNVTRAAPPSNNANLSNLVLSQGTLTPAFAAATISYTASVANSATSITVTPTKADAGASITVNGTPVTSGNPSGSITLAMGSNIITTIVTAQDGTTTKTYTVNVTRATAQSNNADLSNFVLSQGTLTPVFAAVTTSYTALVSTGTTSITITPTKADAGASITVNGTPVASGSASASIALAVGSNMITTVVTAQNGTTTKTYTVNVTRAAPSNNADLSNLVISQATLTPAFAANTTSYVASVPNSTTSLTVTPTKADAGAAITVNGTTVASGTPSGSIALAVGSNIITVVVTAQNGTTTKTYTVTVNRAPSNNADLSNLVLSQGTLTPAFATATTSYAASVANSVISTTVTPTKADAGASITVNGTPVASGSPSGSIMLTVGSNVITTIVTAQDGTTTKTYSVTITKAAGSCESPTHQAYISNITSGNQAYRGELGMEFIVNNTAGIIVKQLGAFDDGGNGITGLQSGGVRVAIFNRNTHTIVPGLDVTITGTADHYTGNHRIKDITPVTLPVGDYVIVAKGYYSGELNGNSGIGGATYPTGDNGGGAITFGNETSYGPDDPNGFTYPGAAANLGTTNRFLAGTLTFTTTVSCGGLSGNADLSNLALSQGTLTPAFAATTTSYTASVPNGTTSITVTPTKADAGASITVNGTPVTSGNPSGSITLAVGSNIITTIVTAQDGTTTKTYTANITRAAGGPSNNADLSNLIFSQGTLTPVFAATTTSYTASVSNGTTSITVTPTKADAGASITVNGTPVTSASPSGSITLAVGSNIITVVVTAQDGTTTKTYTANITRAAGGLSNNADLSNFVLSQGTLTPVFAVTTTSYTASVSNSTTSLTVTPTKADAGATITVNGTSVTSGSPSGSIALAVGSNIITTIVTAQDGTTTKTYTVTITRAAVSGCESPAHQAYVSNITSGNQAYRGELGMEFIVNNAAGIIVKQLGAFDDGANGITGLQSGGVRVAIFNRNTHTIVPGLDVTITGTADHYTGNHRMKDITPVTLPQGDYVIVAKGYYSGELNGNSGIGGVTYPTGDNGAGAITFGNETSYGPDDPNGFTYPGAAANLGTTNRFLAGTLSFTTTVSCGGLSTNADLSNLALSQGTLTPVFAANTASYTASVPNSTTSITVTPTKADAGASITVNGTPVTSGTASGSIGLAVGSNIITVVVTAQDGTTTKTYTVNITRSAAGPSNNADLSNLVLSQGALTPVFTTATTSYTASVSNGTTSITVIPTKADAAASITVNGTTVASGSPSGSIALAVGSNIITTIVTAQDGTTTKTYTVNVTRAAAGLSNNADLSNLVLSQGTLTPVFAAATTSYTASVSNSTTSMTVTPAKADAGASITVNGTTVASGSASGSISLVVGSNIIAVVVTAQNGTTTKTYIVNVTRAAGSGCESAPAQSYISNTQTGNQAYRGELGMDFTVNNASGIIVKQLGVFDHQGNGITGLQPGGGIQVAIFNKTTQAIVPGLDVIITGNGDHYTLNHRMKDITPVTLMPGQYVIVAKGYNSNELNGNSGIGGGPYLPGDNGGGAITFGSQSLWGPDDPNGFNYPNTSVDLGTTNRFLAGTFSFTVPINCFSATIVKSGGGPTDIDQNEMIKSTGLKVYPNPGHGQFNVQLFDLAVPSITIYILDQDGRSIEQKTISLTGKTSSLTVPFNLKNHSAGIYFIKVTSADGIKTGKMELVR